MKASLIELSITTVIYLRSLGVSANGTHSVKKDIKVPEIKREIETFKNLLEFFWH